MTLIDSILVPLDGSVRSAGALGCVMWLAGRLGAEVHILGAGCPEMPVQEELERLHVPRAHWSAVTLHLTTESPEQAVLNAVAQYGIGLVVMTARGAGSQGGGNGGRPVELGHVTRWVVEQSTVPVLVIPPSYEERLPWTRALVPVSGEPEADEVLVLTVRLANAIGLQATVVHVLDHPGEEAGLAVDARYADSMHHEYPRRLQELVERGLPGCTPTEAGCIADVVLCRGDVSQELLEMIREQRADVLIVGWHGTFLAGHAAVIRTLLPRITCPVLLARSAPRGPFKLKVGEALE